ncbi:MAG: HAMP domain-containing sensor histidine kinase [Chloroflexota bacterium]
MLSRPGTWVARSAPSARAHGIQRISVQVGQAPLDLGRQAELLWDALAEVVNTRKRALLLLCPEWEVVAMVESSAPYGLSRTQLRLTSPILQWLGNPDTSVAQWWEMAVLPQLRDASSQERNLFERLEAEILVPMRVDGALSGVLLLGAKTGKDACRRKERELLAGVAQAVARSMENARLYAVQRARVADLMSANEAQSDYILAISHQLKTPIAAVKASAEMLADSVADSRAIRERLASAIVRGVDSLDRLVTELTEYGKMRHATLELHRVETDLCSLVAETCALLQPLVEEKGLRLRVDAAPTLPWVMADPHRVQQVLSNLLSNAIRFTPAGGEISVRLRQDGDRLLTQVQDNGPGIPEAQRQWVFEAFRGGSDTSRGPAGSGLGLAIAKALTELHGGTIRLESQEGKGTTFSFALPLGPVQVNQK